MRRLYLDRAGRQFGPVGSVALFELLKRLVGGQAGMSGAVRRSVRGPCATGDDADTERATAFQELPTRQPMSHESPLVSPVARHDPDQAIDQSVKTQM
ncbi:hypothetical protein [Methylobacterium sp. SI9]|uniref:hypothetical protein n=1 Tax=Methylobacterium guangdongense TaxID=3138811 RepID=UPI00313CE5B2